MNLVEAAFVDETQAGSVAERIAEVGWRNYQSRPLIKVLRPTELV